MNATTYRRYGHGQFLFPVLLLLALGVMFIFLKDDDIGTLLAILMILSAALIIYMATVRPEYRLEVDRLVIRSYFTNSDIPYRNILKCDLFQDLKVNWTYIRYGNQEELYSPTEHRIRIRYTEGGREKDMILRAERANIFRDELRQRAGRNV